MQIFRRRDLALLQIFRTRNLAPSQIFRTRDLALLQIFRRRDLALLQIFRRARRGIRRYLSLVEELASTMAELYPGWRMRIYHNVTGVGDRAGFKQTFMNIP